MDPFAVLDLAPDASQRDIKKAYRRLAMAHHPDRNPGDPAAAKRFLQVKDAYELLSDPHRRAAWFGRSRRADGQGPDDDWLDSVTWMAEHAWRTARHEVLPRYVAAYGLGAELVWALRQVFHAGDLAASAPETSQGISAFYWGRPYGFRLGRAGKRHRDALRPQGRFKPPNNRAQDVVHTAGRRDERIVAAVADLDRAFAEEPRLARYRYRRVLLEGDGGPLEDIAIEADVMGGILGIIGLEQTWRWIMPRQMLEVRLEAVPLLFLAGVTPHGEPELQLVPLGALHFGLQARIDEWLEFGGDSAKAG